jgi:glyoxylase-like metal-dependent hydrolase (beta-lactamase superfamily II)
VPPLTVTPLPAGGLVLTSELWASNSAVVPSSGARLVCDPSIFPDEIAEVRAAASGGAPVHVLVTHSDFDHVCGIPAFADATVVAGPSTAKAIADGTARGKLDASGPEWGTAWDGELRVDVVAGGEPVQCGDLRVAAVDSRGHIDDGSAFVVLERGLLLAGDYLSPVCPPIVLGSVDGAVAAIERLLSVINEYGISTVVPGHGPLLDAASARRIGAEDIEYLTSLQAAATEAVRIGASPNPALLIARAVVPPRPARPDFDAFDWPSANARRALGEAGHEAFRGVRR